MSTILYNEKGAKVVVEDAVQVSALLKDGYTTEAPEVPEADEQEELDLDGGAQGSNGDDDSNDVDLDLDIIVDGDGDED